MIILVLLKFKTIGPFHRDFLLTKYLLSYRMHGFTTRLGEAYGIQVSLLWQDF